MAKGSQLVQLKAALNQAGVIGQKPSGKKRKRSAAPLEKDKLKTAAKLEEIHRRLNPFDEKVTKLKHNVPSTVIPALLEYSSLRSPSPYLSYLSPIDDSRDGQGQGQGRLSPRWPRIWPV